MSSDLASQIENTCKIATQHRNQLSDRSCDCLIMCIEKAGHCALDTQQTVSNVLPSDREPLLMRFQMCARISALINVDRSRDDCQLNVNSWHHRWAIADQFLEKGPIRESREQCADHDRYWMAIRMMSMIGTTKRDKWHGRDCASEEGDGRLARSVLRIE